MDEFCLVWSEIIAKPTDPELIRRVRACVEDMLEHIEGCERCSGLVENVRDAAAIYHALGMEAPDHQKDEALRQQFMQARADEQAVIVSAVREALLPRLPLHLRTLHEVAPGVSELTIFLAAEAVSMAVHRWVRQAGPSAPSRFTMTLDGSLLLEGSVVIPADVLKREIAAVAEVDEMVAGKLLDWLREGARAYARLFLGLDSRAAAYMGVDLTLTERSADADLLVRWSNAMTANGLASAAYRA